ncbi:MAG: DUF72 domain-containing protein [Armatimonadota bacterium]|nr:DUF72 domain-containing protein [Armatimonadota bacterium]
MPGDPLNKDEKTRAQPRAQLRLGTMGFSYKEWAGPFYPAGTSPRGYLAAYARHFNTVELDTTFYASPRPSTVRGWYTSTPPYFLFAAKLPHSITHEKGLVGAAEDLSDFVRTMSLLAEKLGPLLIQLPPSYTVARLEEVRRFLGELPAEFQFAIEFRHRSWYVKTVFDLLREKNVALVAVDYPRLPRRLELTARWTYLRWVGRRSDVQTFDRLVLDRTADLQHWAGLLLQRLEEATTVYGYFNNHYAGHAPASVRQFQRLLGLDDAVSVPVGEQPLLFQG